MRIVGSSLAGGVDPIRDGLISAEGPQSVKEKEMAECFYGCLGQPLGGSQGPPFGPTSSGLPGGNTLSARALT
jgi:hypothetical protein